MKMIQKEHAGGGISTATPSASAGGFIADKERIAHLEFIINEIDGALCNYCNTVLDTDHPFHPMDEGAQKATFKDLRDAYNLWHKNHNAIGDISMRFFVEHERYAMVLRQIADGHRYSTIEGAVKAAKGAFNKE